MDRLNGAGANGRDQGRAERFEDEKRRIIESCFSKKEVDGSLQETYITHIRIVEYSNSPTSPPPPQTRTPDSEKPRVIIVAVRKSGRVRVHKSKENSNGTFSIGKTWNLDDLSRVESFTSPEASFSQREWAGDTGFVVTLGKPYFWTAQTDKEKKFFIASLVKIYGKYTGGKTPELVGFDQKELDQVLGTGRRQPSSGSRPPLPENTSQSGLSASSALSVGSRQGAPSPLNGSLNAPTSPAGSIDSTRSQNQQTLQRLAGSNKSQDSVANSFATIRSDDGSNFAPRSRNGMIGPSASPARFGEPLVPVPQDEKPPERKRPPMDPTRPQGLADRDLVPAPLMSPGMRRDPVAPPPRSMDRMSPRQNSLDQRSETSSLQGSFKERAERSLTPAADTSSLKSSFKERSETPASTTETAKEETAASLKSPTNGSFSTAPSSAALDTPTDSPVAPPEPEEMRPGLGPMIRAKKSKGDIAGAFWKAASAANAFKPRPGGAGDRLLRAQNKPNEGPDGITGVVPAPPRPEPRPPSRSTETPQPQTPEPPKSTDRTSLPEVKVTVPNSSRPTSLQSSLKEATRKAEEPPAEEEKRRSIVVGNDSKYLATLGVDPSVLDNRSIEFTKWLDYFGWVPGDKMRSRNMDEMKTDVERELNRAQAGGWLSRFREEDERVDAIKKGLDLAMTECEELDNLLTLYSVELSTLSDDIAYIEAQGQGLQVQTANQKLLKRELESLLETCAITSDDLTALRIAPLEKLSGLEDIEAALVTLYKAMIKIDPGLGGNEMRKSEDATMDSDQAGLTNTDYGKMRIVQEKKEMYMQESSAFMRRLVGYMAGQFDDAYITVKGALDGALSKKIDSRHHDMGRDLLWKYSPLILYAKEVDPDNWNRMLQVYQDKSHPLYKAEFRDVLEAWKRNARKSTGEEAELLFTSQVEKQQEGSGIATTARKLTVKRSQTLARSLRSPLLDGSSKTTLDKSGDGRSLPYEVFGAVLDDMLPLVEMEQNFFIDFFHTTTLEQAEFPDAVAATLPRDRRGGDLKRHRLMEPDRELARRVTRSMEAIFSFLEQDLQNLVDWVLANDALQGVGVLATLERKIADISQTNQDFLNNILQKLHGNLESRFKKFVDEQIRAIEETKVKINKRKGVIAFVRVFPNFSAAVENMLAGIDPNLGIRAMVDREYDRILKSIFDSLKVIARETPGASSSAAVASSASSADPEDKEALNFHILLIENMNHFLEETDSRGLEILEDWRAAASGELAEHMDLYLNAVMRRPLGRLLEYLENIEAQLQAGKSAAAVGAQPSNSKATFNKVLGGYDAREVRKGIDTLRKRVEKHFGDAEDDPTASRGLVTRVLRECEKFYGTVEQRISSVTTNVYGGDVLFEWPRQEVKSAFSTVGR